MKTFPLYCGSAALLIFTGDALAQANTNATNDADDSAYSADSALYQIQRKRWRPSFHSYSAPLLAEPSYRLDCAGPCDATRGGGGVAMGAEFNRYFGAQLGYMQLPKASEPRAST